MFPRHGYMSRVANGRRIDEEPRQVIFHKCSAAGRNMSLQSVSAIYGIMITRKEDYLEYCLEWQQA